jgi:hypothetical protein
VKTALALAISAYLWTMALALIPPYWVHVPAPLVFLLCPACILTITVDPSFSTVALFLAPIDAFIYGLIGIWIASKLRRSSIS